MTQTNTFAVTEEQHLLADSVRRLLRQPAAWERLAEQGVLATAFGEAWGGIAGDARTIAVTMAQLGAALDLSPYLATAVIAGRILQHWADENSARSAIEAIIQGVEIVVLAHEATVDPDAPPRCTAIRRAGEWLVSGFMPAVRHAPSAHTFLVPVATADGSIQIVRLSRDHPGLTLEAYRCIDGAAGASMRIIEACVPESAVMTLDAPANEVLDDATGWGILGLAAETAGIVGALNAATFDYLKSRKQFGTPIGDFQALRHRAADMWVEAEELLALVELGIASMGRPVGAARGSLMAAIGVVTDWAGRRIGNESVQMHGGMGVSDELNVSHYFRRLAAIRAELGSEDAYRLCFRALARTHDWTETLLREESEALRQFREEVRRFVRENLPSDLSRKVQLGLKLHKQDYVRWQKILYAHGWFAGAWPREHGGQGWDLAKQLAFTQQAALDNAPMVMPYGVSMVGPVLYTFGTALQRDTHLPGILSSDVWWCQGYSEPGAGSDLASLKTSAVLDGGDYIVNGTKMWTTEAHWADMMHCLVRTQQTGKPQQGISFLLIDMRTPGITVRPIITLDGIHHTNQVFFDQVRVPVQNRVGAEGEGWTIAKFLLGHERTSIADTGPKLRLLRRLQNLHSISSEGLPASRQVLRGAKLADLEIQLLALCAVERRYVAAWMQGTRAGAEASLLKIRGTEILQGLTELALELEGPMAAVHDPQMLLGEPDERGSLASAASAIAHEYLYARCWSIFGGTNEIQRNIIARQILA
jgi:alkylation response protein AidB-like acyl-CoA dehydrogenase